MYCRSKKGWESFIRKQPNRVLRRPTPVLIGTAEGQIFPCRMKGAFGARRYSEVILSISDGNGGETMTRCLLDTGCTKSMILKKFTETKRRIRLSKEDTIQYETYGSKFISSMTASVGFKMIEFEEHKHQTNSYTKHVMGNVRNNDTTKHMTAHIVTNDATKPTHTLHNKLRKYC